MEFSRTSTLAQKLTIGNQGIWGANIGIIFWPSSVANRARLLHALDTLLLKTTADAAKSEMLRAYLVLYRSPRGGESAFVID
jgi:hypothetical protein